MNTSFNQHEYELTIREVHHNLPRGPLYQRSDRCEADAKIASCASLVAHSGAKTSRRARNNRSSASQLRYLRRGQARGVRHAKSRHSCAHAETHPPSVMMDRNTHNLALVRRHAPQAGAES